MKYGSSADYIIVVQSQSMRVHQRQPDPRVSLYNQRKWSSKYNQYIATDERQSSGLQADLPSGDVGASSEGTARAGGAEPAKPTFNYEAA